MPIVDEHTQRTDHQPAPRWPWIIAIVVFCAFWLAVAIIGLLGQYAWWSAAQPGSTAAVAAIRSANSTVLQQAEVAHNNSDWATAAAMIDAVDESAPLDLMDKHTYFRVGAVSKAKGGDAEASAAFYERFLGMGARIAKPECSGCHAAGAAAPHRLTDLQTSELGKEYFRQLKIAGKLDATRQRLRQQLKRQPDDLRLHLLLYHLESHAERPSVALKHAEALAEAEQKK